MILKKMRLIDTLGVKFEWYLHQTLLVKVILNFIQKQRLVVRLKCFFYRELVQKKISLRVRCN